MFALYSIPGTGIAVRIHHALSDISTFNSNANTSVGLRFEFWKSSIDAIRQRPFFGWGFDGFYALQQVQVQNGLIIPQALNFSHAHNLYLDIGFKKGLVTLFFFLLSLGYPLFTCCKGLGSKIIEYKIYALLGCILILSSCSYILTDIFLYLPIGAGFYYFSIVWIMAGLNNHAQPLSLSRSSAL